MTLLRPIALAVAVLLGMTASGCAYNGLNDFAMPGTQGRAEGSYDVKIQMANVGNLVSNNPVRLGDVDVGVIRRIELQGWNALVTIRLNRNVQLPANATARVGQVSLLGAKYVEIAPPRGEPAVGRLRPGATIALARTGKYPETEDVLASVATLLNGGSLQQLRTITYELNKAVDGRAPQYRDLLDQLNRLITGLDAQKGDIVRAIDGVDRLSARLARQDAVLRGTLQDLPPALDTLERERGRLVSSLEEVGRFGNTFGRVVDNSAGTLAANVSNLTPAVREIADSGDDLVKSLDLLGTIIFPASRVGEVFRGDYINFWLTLDLSMGTLDRNFLTGTPAQGTLGAIERTLAGTTRPMVNPMLPPGSGVPGAPPFAPQPVPNGASPTGGGPETSRPPPTTSAPPPSSEPPARGPDESPAPPTTSDPPPEQGGLLDGLLGGR